MWPRPHGAIQGQVLVLDLSGQKEVQSPSGQAEIYSCEADQKKAKVFLLCCDPGRPEIQAPPDSASNFDIWCLAALNLVLGSFTRRKTYGLVNPTSAGSTRSFLTACKTSPMRHAAPHDKAIAPATCGQPHRMHTESTASKT